MSYDARTSEESRIGHSSGPETCQEPPPPSLSATLGSTTRDGGFMIESMPEYVGRGKANPPAQASAFDKLPEEIIQHILYYTDPNTFASLVVLNQSWRRASQSAQLYAYQLSRMPALTDGDIPGSSSEDGELPRLRHCFKLGLKRSSPSDYLQPRETIVKLISTSTSSSAPFPGADVFRFTFSPRGHKALAFNSSRLHIIDTEQDIPTVERELKVLRRPVSAAILDDGSILAILSSPHQINIYGLSGAGVRRARSLTLDESGREIALSPDGLVLAVALDEGIEVCSLSDSDPLPARRIVKCEAVDSLMFSTEGSVILGTTISPASSNSVVLSTSLYDDVDASDTQQLSQAWTTQILFPNKSQHLSHATLLPHPSDGDTSWLFAFDRRTNSLSAIPADALGGNGIGFPRPSLRPGDKSPAPNALPAASEDGNLVAVSFGRKYIYVYSIFDRLSDGGNPSHANGYAENGASGSQLDLQAAHVTNGFNLGCGVSTAAEQCESNGTSSKETPIMYREIGAVEGASVMRWVWGSGADGDDIMAAKRLLVAAPGGVGVIGLEEGQEVLPVDGGRIVVFDFGNDKGSLKREVSIELGHGTPQSLEEEKRDLEADVAVVRMRTLASKKKGRLGGGRPSTAVDSSRDLSFDHPIEAGPSTLNSRPSTSSGFQRSNMVMETPDGPFSGNQPPSMPSIQRSSTSAAPLRGGSADTVYAGVARRPGGRWGLPHESDGDNYVPPPPPYQRKAEAPLPEDLQRSLLPRSTIPPQGSSRMEIPPAKADKASESLMQNALHRVRSLTSRRGSSQREQTEARVPTEPVPAIPRVHERRPAVEPGPAISQTHEQRPAIEPAPAIPQIYQRREGAASAINDATSSRADLPDAGRTPIDPIPTTPPTPPRNEIAAPENAEDRSTASSTPPPSTAVARKPPPLDGQPASRPADTIISRLSTPISPIPEPTAHVRERATSNTSTASTIPPLNLSTNLSAPTAEDPSPPLSALTKLQSRLSRRISSSSIQSSISSFADIPASSSSQAAVEARPSSRNKLRKRLSARISSSSLRSAASSPLPSPAEIPSPAPLQPSHLDPVSAPVLPSAEQLERLERRYSRPISLSGIPSAGPSTSTTSARDFNPSTTHAQSFSRPRAQSPQQFQQNTYAAYNGGVAIRASRSSEVLYDGPPSSSGSYSGSYSTPNLLSTTHEEADYEAEALYRLDTIQSAASTPPSTYRDGGGGGDDDDREAPLPHLQHAGRYYQASAAVPSAGPLAHPAPTSWSLPPTQTGNNNKNKSPAQSSHQPQQPSNISFLNYQQAPLDALSRPPGPDQSRRPYSLTTQPRSSPRQSHPHDQNQNRPQRSTPHSPSPTPLNPPPKTSQPTTITTAAAPRKPQLTSRSRSLFRSRSKSTSKSKALSQPASPAAQRLRRVSERGAGGGGGGIGAASETEVREEEQEEEGRRGGGRGGRGGARDRKEGGKDGREKAGNGNGKCTVM
ncbi:MAG: hypothetical protein M1819_007084 [Sarea resinae]|nr:MAG: hypothetical protein M1819_007084 [Sarea resinae]